MADNRVQQTAQARQLARQREQQEVEYFLQRINALRTTDTTPDSPAPPPDNPVPTEDRRHLNVRLDVLFQAMMKILGEHGIEGVELLLLHSGFLAKATGNARKEWISFTRRYDDDMTAAVVIELNQRWDPPVRITDMGGTDPLGSNRRLPARS